MSSRSVREATHAGSWYTSDGKKLKTELTKNLSKVTSLPDLKFEPPVVDAKAIIAPHAGYSYSGPTAAWAYAAIPCDRIKRVFLLGPSHHTYIKGIALSPFRSYNTPLGELPLDLDTIASLRKTGIFEEVEGDVDEEEHSLEMHLPYIRHVFAGRDDLRLVPLIVGHPSESSATELNLVLSKYWEDEATFFVISSDFCHWGTRFSHTPYYANAPSPPIPVPPLPLKTMPASFEPPDFFSRFANASSKITPIWQSIQYMDHEGMDLLRRPAEEGAKEKWEAYLDRTKNTICGRNPITVLVSLVQHLYRDKEGKPEFTFVRYEQSSRCESLRDSSVSYVSGVLRLPKPAV